jgi:hypothetical protein
MELQVEAALMLSQCGQSIVGDCVLLVGCVICLCILIGSSKEQRQQNKEQRQQKRKTKAFEKAKEDHYKKCMDAVKNHK